MSDDLNSYRRIERWTRRLGHDAHDVHERRNEDDDARRSTDVDEIGSAWRCLDVGEIARGCAAAIKTRQNHEADYDDNRHCDCRQYPAEPSDRIGGGAERTHERR